MNKYQIINKKLCVFMDFNQIILLITIYDNQHQIKLYFLDYFLDFLITLQIHRDNI